MKVTERHLKNATVIVVVGMLVAFVLFAMSVNQ
jgi:hypothetical protein